VASSADIRNNIMSGSVRNRNGAKSYLSNNLTNVSERKFKKLFGNPDQADFSLRPDSGHLEAVTAAPGISTDFCGQRRPKDMHDPGAIQYSGGKPCDPRARLPGN
jgi:hypothetical protein